MSNQYTVTNRGEAEIVNRAVPAARKYKGAQVVTVDAVGVNRVFYLAERSMLIVIAHFESRRQYLLTRKGERILSRYSYR